MEYLMFNGSRTLRRYNERRGRRDYVHSKFKGGRIHHYYFYEALVPQVGRPLWLVRGPNAVVGACFNKSDAKNLAIALWDEDTNRLRKVKGPTPRSVLGQIELGILTELGF